MRARAWWWGWLVAAVTTWSSGCPVGLLGEECLEQVHPEWHACHDKSGCDTARADADGGPARGDGGTVIVCGCCEG